MAFWKSSHAAPAQSHHFRVEWGEGDQKVHSHTVKSVTKPSVEVNEGMYQVGNQKFKYPGIASWNDVTISFVDDKETTRRLINKFIAQGWLHPNENHPYGLKAPAQGLQGTTVLPGSIGLFEPKNYRLGVRNDDAIVKSQTGDGIGDIRIIQHAVVSERVTVPGREPTFWRPGEPSTFKMNTRQIDLDTWTLKNAWIKSINFGQLDYSSDELITIEVVIAYDYCEIEWGYSYGLT